MKMVKKMNQNQYNSLRAEIDTVTNFLEKIPSNRFLERLSFEGRLKELEEKLDSVDTLRINKKAIITFRGKPVDRSHGITAEFSGKAINGLNDMVASFVASLNKNLKDRGPIPDRSQNQLMITGTAVGSFGFEFELPEPDYDIFAEKNNTENALSNIQSLLRKTSDGTDDDISDLMSDIHPRAIKKISEFLIFLQRNEALFAMEYNKQIFRVETDSQLDTIINRLDDKNISITSETYQGRFKGFLPKSNKFEFFDNGSGEIITGKVDASMIEPDVINSYFLDRLATVTFNVVQFGQAKPKYSIVQLSDIIV